MAAIGFVAAAATNTAVAPAQGWEPKPVGEQLSLESYTRPGARVRGRDDGTLYFGTVDGKTENDASDANFIKRPGRSNGNCWSFESVKWPGRFLRRHGTQVYLVGGGFIDPNFNADSTFCRNAAQRYESASAPGYFLRRSGSQLVASRVNSLDDYGSLDDTVIFERDPQSLGLVLWPSGLTGVDRDGNHYYTTQGPCTGVTPFGGQTRTTIAYLVLFHGYPLWGGAQTRTVVGGAASNPFFGMYPWIRVTSRPGGFIFKIEQGVNICGW